ncbi:hypothetical protein ACLOJK_016898 [Asimina triloba]
MNQVPFRPLKMLETASFKCVSRSTIHLLNLMRLVVDAEDVRERSLPTIFARSFSIKTEVRKKTMLTKGVREERRRTVQTEMATEGCGKKKVARFGSLEV